MCLEEPRLHDYSRATAGVLGTPFPLQGQSQGPRGGTKVRAPPEETDGASPGEKPLGATEKLVAYLRSIICR